LIEPVRLNHTNCQAELIGPVMLNILSKGGEPLSNVPGVAVAFVVHSFYNSGVVQ
jgi:hypothetical protein